MMDVALYGEAFFDPLDMINLDQAEWRWLVFEFLGPERPGCRGTIMGCIKLKQLDRPAVQEFVRDTLREYLDPSRQLVEELLQQPESLIGGRNRARLLELQEALQVKNEIETP